MLILNNIKFYKMIATILLVLFLLAILFIAYQSFQITELTKSKQELDDLKSKIVTLKDEIPVSETAQAYALKLSNELADYFKIDEEHNEISITVIK